jgi:hypothetical protein
MAVYTPLQAAGLCAKVDNFVKTLIAVQYRRNKFLALNGTIGLALPNGIIAQSPMIAARGCFQLDAEFAG